MLSGKETNMKVCHMTSAHGEEDVRIFHKECVSLARAGYDVYLVERGKSYDKDGVHILGVGEISGSRWKRMTGGARKVYRRALEVDADIYHFHDPELLPYGLKLKRKGKKVIFDSHENTLESILEKQWIPSPVRKIIYKWFEREQRTVCGKCDAVITVTPSMVSFFREINKVSVQVSNFPILQDKTEEPDFQSKSIAFAGGISPQWEHHIILRVMEKIPDCRYRLSGSGESGYLNLLRNMPAWDRVDYLGKIPHASVSHELARCSVGMALLKPSRNSDWHNGTIGNTKIFEEMMAGLPVICTDFKLWKEFVDRYHCGICVNPENVDEVANAIEYLFVHPKEARRMGENGRRAVQEEFNWGVEEKTLRALYEDLLKERI